MVVSSFEELARIPAQVLALAAIDEQILLIGTTSGLWVYSLSQDEIPRKVPGIGGSITTIAPIDGTQAYLVINGNSVYRLSGNNLQELLTPVALDSLVGPIASLGFTGLANLGVASPDEVYATGDKGTILFFDGHGWERQQTPFDSLPPASRPWIWKVVSSGDVELAITRSSLLILDQGALGEHSQWRFSSETPPNDDCVFLSLGSNGILAVAGGAPPCAFVAKSEGWARIATVPNTLGSFQESQAIPNGLLFWSTSGLIAEIDTRRTRFFLIPGGRIEGVQKVGDRTYFVTRDGLLARWSTE